MNIKPYTTPKTNLNPKVRLIHPASDYKKYINITNYAISQTAEKCNNGEQTEPFKLRNEPQDICLGREFRYKLGCTCERHVLRLMYAYTGLLPCSILAPPTWLLNLHNARNHSHYWLLTAEKTFRTGN